LICRKHLTVVLAKHFIFNVAATNLADILHHALPFEIAKMVIEHPWKPLIEAIAFNGECAASHLLATNKIKILFKTLKIPYSKNMIDSSFNFIARIAPNLKSTGKRDPPKIRRFLGILLPHHYMCKSNYSAKDTFLRIKNITLSSFNLINGMHSSFDVISGQVFFKQLPDHMHSTSSI
jgi:hypothetical protein